MPVEPAGVNWREVNRPAIATLYSLFLRNIFCSQSNGLAVVLSEAAGPAASGRGRGIGTVAGVICAMATRCGRRGGSGIGPDSGSAAGTASAGGSLAAAGCWAASAPVLGAAPSGGAAAAGISVAFGSAGIMGDVAAVLNAPVGVLAAPIGARSPSKGPFGAADASGASVGVAPAGTAAGEASEGLDCSGSGKGCLALSRLALAFRGSGTVALAASWRNVGSFGGPT